MEAACRVANIHGAIMALPDGYDIEIGPDES
jgi:ABC-type multidrug transport system fused ATPase/permease subunit